MTRREAVLTTLGVFAFALGVRLLVAPAIEFPKPEDTAYYVGVARNLVEGRGLVSDALWSFGTPPLVFPRPAFEVWMPLPSLLAAVPVSMLAGSPVSLEAALRAAQVVSVALGALVAVLTWRLAADVAGERGVPAGRARVLAIGAGLTAGVYLPLVLHSVLPDSTMLFGALALGACLLMTRVLRDPRGARVRDPRLTGIGLLLGLAALTRNEAVWLALVWAWLAWRAAGAPRATRARMIGVVAVVSVAVFAPWAVRNLAAFGTPLPGQAISNALYVSGMDIFAWTDPPTLARHLALGPAGLVGLRLNGLWHNLASVLLFPGVPVSLIGLVALPWIARARTLRPLLLLSGITFLVTSLLFPVATTWGTFLHAAAPVHVMLIVSAMLALDAAIVRIGRVRGWTRPVAWLGPALAVFTSASFSLVLLPAFGTGSHDTADLYGALPDRLAAAGEPLRPGEPVIHDFPIWLAETARVPSLALPDEPPSAVLDLARTFPGTRLVIIADPSRGQWPALLDEGDPAARCFEPVDLRRGAPTSGDDPLADVRVYRITCDDAARRSP